MLCSQCGKKDAVVMGLCQDCLSGKHNKHKDGISFEEFKERYLQSENLIHGVAIGTRKCITPD